MIVVAFLFMLFLDRPWSYFWAGVFWTLVFSDGAPK